MTDGARPPLARCNVFFGELMIRPRKTVSAALLLMIASALPVFAQSGAWKFAVSGDSRNCGDIVMPAIAAGVRQSGAQFYWHLGELRKISGVDEATSHQPANLAKPPTKPKYLNMA